MYRKILLIVGCLLPVLGFQAIADIRGGSTVIHLSSETLGESRELMIHLPNNYSEYKDTSYPVLYLLDGQRNLAHTVGTLDLLNQSGMAQEMIIVGIVNTERSRDFTPTFDENYRPWGDSGGADNFLNFLGHELKPYINKHYRTNGYSILSGHSLGGLLAIYALHTRPEMFQAYFSFSPSLWWQKEVIFPDAENFFQSKDELNKYLYVNMGNEGGQMLSAYERYLALLNNSGRGGFKFDTDLETSEGHNTTALAGMSLALQKQFASLFPSESVVLAGVPAIEGYYKGVAERYGYDAKPGYKALNHAGYNALDKEDFDLAIQIFKKNIVNHPHKSDAYDSLADGYEAMGDMQAALLMRQKALALSYEENVENNALKTRLYNLQQKLKNAGE